MKITLKLLYLQNLLIEIRDYIEIHNCIEYLGIRLMDGISLL